jgi:hypothetical protein
MLGGLAAAKRQLAMAQGGLAAAVGQFTAAQSGFASRRGGCAVAGIVSALP